MSFIAHPEDNRIYWMTQDNRAGEIALNAAPLEVGELLQERLFSQKESVVLTSATMSTQGNFGHITERLGLEDADELLVDSPFDYPKSVLLCIPPDMPDPTNGGYRGALEQALMDICRAAEGRTMGLFTSHASLQAARSGIRESLERDGFKVLAQGVDGTPRALLETFMKEPKSVLLGTASFWEGVDIPGGALKALGGRQAALQRADGACLSPPALSCSRTPSTSTPCRSRCCASGRGSDGSSGARRTGEW